jgi:hypothetical protein
MGLCRIWRESRPQRTALCSPLPTTLQSCMFTAGERLFANGGPAGGPWPSPRAPRAGPICPIRPPPRAPAPSGRTWPSLPVSAGHHESKAVRRSTHGVGDCEQLHAATFDHNFGKSSFRTERQQVLRLSEHGNKGKEAESQAPHLMGYGCLAAARYFLG